MPRSRRKGKVHRRPLRRRPLHLKGRHHPGLPRKRLGRKIRQCVARSPPAGGTDEYPERCSVRADLGGYLSAALSDLLDRPRQDLPYQDFQDAVGTTSLQADCAAKRPRRSWKQASTKRYQTLSILQRTGRTGRTGAPKNLTAVAHPRDREALASAGGEPSGAGSVPVWRALEERHAPAVLPREPRRPEEA